MDRFALVVGIDRYQHLSVPRLEFAAADAYALARQFQLPGLGPYGLPEANLILLRDSEATRMTILESLDQLAGRSGPDDLVLIYFAGHGAAEAARRGGDSDDGLRKYLVPYDVDLEDLKRTAIDFSALSENIERLRSRRVLMIFDCCYSGAAGGRTIPMPGVRTTPEIGTEYLEKVSGKGRMVFTACTGKELAKENRDFGHGVFTHFLLEGLGGKADFKGDRRVDAEELWMFAQRETVRATNGEQSPVRTGWVEGDSIILTLCRDNETTADYKLDVRQKLVERFPNIREILIADADEPEQLASEAAKYLRIRITNNMKITVSCGRTLIETISQLPRLRVANIEIYPLNGSPTDEVRITDSMVLTYLLWSRFDAGKARAHVVPTGIPPSLFASVKDDLADLAEQILQKARLADMFLFGIGSPTRSNQNIEYLFRKAGVSSEELQQLGAVGEINFHLYDGSGTLLALRTDLSSEARAAVDSYNSKFFSMPAESLVKITESPGVDLVAVAGGISKREAIRAAIRGGFVRTLVTDLLTAEWLADSD